MTAIEGQSPPGIVATGPQRQRLRTDIATVLLHWTFVLLLGTSVVTGFRIAADAADATWSRWLSPLLLQGEVSIWHVWSALGFVMAIVAYVVFLAWAHLTPRVVLDASRIRALSSRDHRTRWQSINVGIYWIGFFSLLTLVTSGTAIYLNVEGLNFRTLTTIHRSAAWVMLSYMALHVGGQIVMGGATQIMKILRPRLVYGVPAAVAAAAALAAGAAVSMLDRGTISALPVDFVPVAPTVDGEAGDPAWASTAPIIVHTWRGANFPSGAVPVTMRAVRDKTYAYFLFEWPDSTRSQKHLPLQKTKAGWRVLETNYATHDENAYYEDKFAVLLARTPRLAAAGTAHLGSRPLADKPAPAGGRGLHYTNDGSVVDMWHWKSVRTGPIGQVDDNYFGPPGPAPADSSERYTGGYRQDTNFHGGFVQNWKKLDAGVVQPLFLPRDPRALHRLGQMDLRPNAGDKGEWWLPATLTVPYSADLDALFPIGTILPSVIIEGPFEGDRGDVRAVGRWANDQWRLEVSRKLDTGSEYDVPIEDGIFLWVAAFDHSQTRHSQHLHPLRLKFQ
jgi:hypothetical protein